MTGSSGDQRVIIVAPVGQDAATMAEVLNAGGIRTRICQSLNVAANEITSRTSAMVLTEEALALPYYSGLIRALRVQPAWSEIPIIALLGGRGNRQVALQEQLAALPGTATILERPMQSATLLNTVQVALRSRDRQFLVRDLLSEQQRNVRDLENAVARERGARSLAERATRLKDEFLATLSHELRTPLNGILLRTDLLMQAGPKDAVTWKKDLEAIQKGAKAQARLIEDLLDVSAIMAGKIRIEVGLVNLSEIISGAIEVIAPTAEAKNIQLKHGQNDPVGSIKGDATRIQQIIWNLLSNAVKYTPRGGRVEISVEREAQDVAIRVTDNGKGIAADFLPHVFDRFSQADTGSTRKYGGLGLGLAIVKYMAELHGGSVSVESAGEGRGSTFTVRLPASEAVDQPGPSVDHSSLAGVHVFIVDDDPGACELLRRILELKDARVSAASSTAEAMKKITELSPDILLCDIGMPERSGYDLIREIRSASELARLPAVAVTAFSRPEDRVLAVQAGFDMHVAKPVNVNELMTVIRALTR